MTVGACDRRGNAERPRNSCLSRRDCAIIVGHKGQRYPKPIRKFVIGSLIMIIYCCCGYKDVNMLGDSGQCRRDKAAYGVGKLTVAMRVLDDDSKLDKQPRDGKKLYVQRRDTY